MTESDKWSAATICVLDTCHGVRGDEKSPGWGSVAKSRWVDRRAKPFEAVAVAF